MSRFVEREKDGVVYMASPVITAKHAFTTRYGGVSEGYLSSLNLGFNRGDERERVMENYRILGRALDVDVMRAAYTKQVHGTHVRTVTDAFSPRRARRRSEERSSVYTTAGAKSPAGECSTKGMRSSFPRTVCSAAARDIPPTAAPFTTTPCFTLPPHPPKKSALPARRSANNNAIFFNVPFPRRGGKTPRAAPRRA